MAIISYRDFAKIRKKHKGQKIVFCSGTFDLTHGGHVLFLEDCKRLGDVLVAVAGEDASIKKIKGVNRPILNEHLRVKMLDSLKPVDYALVGKHHGHPLGFFDHMFPKLKPDIYVVNDDTFKLDYRKKAVEKYGVKMVILKRKCPLEFKKISTTDIIKKIKRIPDNEI